MSNSSTIALDAMGGDHGPSIVIPAALDSLKQDRQLKLILVGDEETIKRHLNSVDPEMLGRLDIKHASQRVEMDDLPSKVLRSKKDSSMRVTIDLVKDGLADACVSAGNTGALMATARYVLKMIPGIDRPAIIGSVPSITGHTHVLDLGANVDCSAEHLLQFAVMGFELIKAVENIDNPKVGLLNIGEEEIKGNEQVKKAAKLLSGSYLNFVGYVEGDAICKGGVDLIVTDGFVGNVSLKSIEGIAKMTNELIKNAFSENLLTKMAGLIAFPVLKKFKDKVDHRLYNGASFLGLKGIVVKSHGNADRVAFANAIKIARLEVEKAVPKRIGEKVEAVFSERKSA